jgi:hypothetical protein
MRRARGFIVTFGRGHAITRQKRMRYRGFHELFKPGRQTADDA